MEMSTVQEIEAAIAHLSQPDLTNLRKWFEEFDAAQWDQQIENDVASGKLNKLAKEALDDLRNGRCKDL